MNGLRELIINIGELVSLSLPIVLGLALLGFFWGLAMYIFHAGDESQIEKGKNIMKWGIVSLFIMVSIWGIIEFIQDDLLGDSGDTNIGVIQIDPL